MLKALHDQVHNAENLVNTPLMYFVNYPLTGRLSPPPPILHVKESYVLLRWDNPELSSPLSIIRSIPFPWAACSATNINIVTVEKKCRNMLPLLVLFLVKKLEGEGFRGSGPEGGVSCPAWFHCSECWLQLCALVLQREQKPVIGYMSNFCFISANSCKPIHGVCFWTELHLQCGLILFIMFYIKGITESRALSMLSVSATTTGLFPQILYFLLI